MPSGIRRIRERVLRSRLDMLTPWTIASPGALEKELDQIARQGWATAFNEALIGLNTLAAPIFDATGGCVGTVGIVNSIQFLEETISDDKVRQIVVAGRRISDALGHRAA